MMAKISVTDNNGILYEIFDTDQYDLKNPIAKATLIAELLDTVEQIDAVEKADGVNNDE